MSNWFHEEIQEIQYHLSRLKQQPLSKETIGGATIITAKRDDLEAKYSGYYKDYGWNKDLLIDSHHKIFLGYQDFEITADEAEALIVHLERLRQIDLSAEKIMVNGTYI